VIVVLSDYPAVTTIPASDLERAKKWYSDALGFKPVVDEPEYVEFNAAGGTRFSLFPTRATAGAGHTVLTFEVDDVDKLAQELRGRGVNFEDYDLPNLKTVNGIATIEGFKGAWFRDSEGNVLSVAQRT
jgi:catechol 2,3-dioxygenase-like lactoylglutathione lyase family enzyme